MQKVAQEVKMARFKAFFNSDKVSHNPCWLHIPYAAEDNYELLHLLPSPSKCGDRSVGSLCASMPSSLSMRNQTRGFVQAGQTFDPATTDSIWKVLQRPPPTQPQLQPQTCYNSERLQRLMNRDQNCTYPLNKHKYLACNQYLYSLNIFCTVYFLSLIALSPPPNYKLDCKEKKLNISVLNGPCMQKVDKFNFEFSIYCSYQYNLNILKVRHPPPPCRRACAYIHPTHLQPVFGAQNTHGSTNNDPA